MLGLFDTIVWRGTLPVVTTPDYEVDVPGGAVSIPTLGGGTIVNSPLANLELYGTTDFGVFTNIFVFPIKVGVSKTFGYSWPPIAAIALPPLPATSRELVRCRPVSGPF